MAAPQQMQCFLRLIQLRRRGQKRIALLLLRLSVPSQCSSNVLNETPRIIDDVALPALKPDSEEIAAIIDGPFCIVALELPVLQLLLENMDSGSHLALTRLSKQDLKLQSSNSTFVISLHVRALA